MFKNLIGGEWVEGPRVSRNINPSDTRDLVGEFAQADADQARQAIAAATQAQPAWGLSTPQQRFDILDTAGAEILARKAELGDLLAREEGKTLPEAIGEAARAGYIFKFFAGEALRVGGEVVPSVRPGVGVEVTREPVGVVGLITPWNFPDRDPRLEDRAGPGLRQRRGAQAGRSGARQRLGHRRHPATARACRRACSTW